MELLKEIEMYVYYYEKLTKRKPSVIRVSVNNYKKIVRELHPNVEEEDSLYTPIEYKGIKITFGVEVFNEGNSQ